MKTVKKILLRFKNNKIYSFEKENTLIKLVSKDIKTNKKYKKLINKKHRPLWIPSVSSFLKISTVFIIVAIISKIGLESKFGYFLEFEVFNTIKIPVIKNNTPIFQNLISINTGIGAILIGLAFFVAQSLMDKEDTEKAKVLLYRSMFFPLLTSGIFIYLILLMGELNYFIYFVVCCFGLAVIYSLGRTIEILIRANDLEKAKIKVFVDILKRNFIKIMNDEIIRRISNNKLFSVGEELNDKYDGVISITPFGPVSKEKYIKIKAPLNGSIVDINFLNLEVLINDLIRTLPFENEIVSRYEKDLDFTSNTTKEKKSPLIYITALADTKVTENTVLMQISKDVIKNNNKLLNDVKQQIKLIFVIKEIRDNEEEARFELSKLKQRCIQLIKDERIEDLKKTLSLYNEMIKELFEFMEQYGGGFSKAQAENERTAFFNERLKPLDWILYDIREFYDKAMESENKDIIRNVAYVPISIAKLAIKNRDHLIYQSFIYYPQLTYIKGFEIRDKNEEISAFMIDRSWRYIKELSDFYLVYEYKEENFLESDFLDFAFYIIMVFQNLLKQCYDYRDIKSFKTILGKMLKIFEGIDNEYEFGDFSENNLYVKLKNLKNQCLFGLGSWVLHEVRESQHHDILDFLIQIKNNLPTDVKELTNLFITTHSFEKEREWGWDDWERINFEEEVYSIDFLSKLEALYAVLALEKLEIKTDEQIDSINLPASRDLAFLAANTSSLTKILKSIESNINEFELILSVKAIAKCNKFLSLLVKAKEEQENIERQIKRDTRISNDKVIKFKKNVVKNINSSYGIKNIFDFYNLVKIEPKKVLEGNEKKFGINTFFDKSAFFDDVVEPHVKFIDIDDGFDFGRSIVRGENKTVIKNIKKVVPVIDKHDLEGYLESSSDITKMIFISVNHAVFDFFGKNIDYNTYIPKWHRDFPKDKAKDFSTEIEGFYKFKGYYIPVYEIFDKGHDSEIIILDVTNIGRFMQYSPVDKGIDVDNVIDNFTINVQEIIKESDKESEILENASEWLTKIGNKEEQALYLQERVIIEIYERFEFVPVEKVVGARIVV